MGRIIPLRWIFVASFGCVMCGGAIAQAGPVNSVARYMGVGWSEGRHARNNCPQSLHPSKPWPYPVTKLWNNQAAGPFAGSGEGDIAMSQPPLPQPSGPQHGGPPQAGPQHFAPQPRLHVAPPRTPSPAKPQREELRGGNPDSDEERSPSDQAPNNGDEDPMNLPPPPNWDEEPSPMETRSPHSIMRSRPVGR